MDVTDRTINMTNFKKYRDINEKEKYNKNPSNEEDVNFNIDEFTDDDIDNEDVPIPYGLYSKGSFSPIEFSNIEAALVPILCELCNVRDNSTDVSCKLDSVSLLLGTRTPNEVANHINKTNLIYLQSINSANDICSSNNNTSSKNSAAKIKRKNRNKNYSYRKHINPTKRMEEFTPCDHDGQCTRFCPCVSINISLSVY
jgi:hypothetical protein